MQKVLGGAQIGSKYGITNQHPQPSVTHAHEILNFAAKSEIKFIDTAENYGNSEEIIDSFSNSVFNVATKISGKNRTENAGFEIISNIQKRISNHTLDTVFVHDWEKLNFSEKGKMNGIVSEVSNVNWGPSLYSTSQLEEMLSHFSCFNSVQVPISVLDQRFIPYFEELRNRGIRIWGRSIFLQGAINFSSPLNSYSRHPDLIKLTKFCKTFDLSPFFVAQKFAEIQNIDFGIFGIAHLDELKAIIEAEKFEIMDYFWDELASNDVQLIDPRLWK